MKRFLHIDFLRSVSIVVIIVVHVLSDNLTNPFRTAIWNYLHFGIVAFIFCSGYVLYSAYSQRLTTLVDVLGWYKKRLFRLLIPFYWYLLIHTILLISFPRYFSGLGIEVSWKFILESVTLIGGINLNWLPLLFLQLGILFPLLVVLFHKKRQLFLGYIILTILATVFFTIWQVPYSAYRQVMWIPWSLFLVLPWFFFKKEQKSSNPLPYFLFSAGAASLFIVLYFFWIHLNRSTTLIDNKYPPNLYYLAYDMCGSFLLLGISFWGVLQKGWIARIYQSISRMSYSLFFIHYIVLDFLLSVQAHMHTHFPIGFQIIFVIGVSLTIGWLLSLSHVLFNKRK